MPLFGDKKACLELYYRLFLALVVTENEVIGLVVSGIRDFEILIFWY